MSETTSTEALIAGIPGLERRAGDVFCEGLSARELASRFGTPLYVYSHEALAHNIADWASGVAGTPHRVFYCLLYTSDAADEL